MKAQFNQNDSLLVYLEPPHLHDPSHVSSVASLPISTLEDLPPTVQSALYSLQQSTSVVYASFLRFQDLLQDRFDRLNPSLDDEGEYTFSEPSFMTYTNSLSAEREYMLSGALTDWRHKASLTRVAIQPYANVQLTLIPTSTSEFPNTIATWWNDLQSEVQSWCEYARAIHVPDYEDTIGEFLAMQKSEPSLTIDYSDSNDVSPLETPAMSTPTLKKDAATIEICEIKERDFALPAFADEIAPISKGLGLITGDFALEESKGRKDSGVCMDS